MTLLEILITVFSLCSAGSGGLAIKCLCSTPKEDQEQEEKVDDNKIEINQSSNHNVEDIISEVVAQHKRNSKEGTDIETHVDITINVHSITHEGRDEIL